MNLDSRTLERLSQESMLLQAIGTALRYLNARQRSVDEVRRRLQRANIDDEIAENAICVLLNKGYLNDREFALEFTRHLSEYKNYSKKRIHYELRRKGIDRSLIEECLSPFNEKIETQKARKLIEKKFPDPKADLFRAKNYLRRNGFDADVIEEALRVDAT
jgi:regulatory protein